GDRLGVVMQSKIPEESEYVRGDDVHGGVNGKSGRPDFVRGVPSTNLNSPRCRAYSVRVCSRRDHQMTRYSESLSANVDFDIPNLLAPSSRTRRQIGQAAARPLRFSDCPVAYGTRVSSGRPNRNIIRSQVNPATARL